MSDVYSNLAANSTLGNAAAAADMTSTIARASQVVDITGQRDGGAIQQTERLYTARARYGDVKYLTDNKNQRDLGGSRGQWGYIKLLTSSEQYAGYLNGQTQRDMRWKEDLVGQGGIATDMSDPANDKTKAGYDKFIITGVSTQFSEKVQITEVFGDNEVVYYFGRDPVIFSINGLLIDSPDNEWFTDWIKLYSEFLRGTQLAKNSELLKLVLPNMTLIGTISSFNYAQDASRDVDIPFSIQFIAKVIEPTPAQGSGMISSNKLAYVDFSKVAMFTGQSDINSLKNQMNSLSGVLMNPMSTLGDKSAALSRLGSSTGGMYQNMLENGRGGLGNFQSTVEGWDQSRASFFSDISNSAAFQSVTSSLLSVRMSLFSPVYGIMSSLSKLVVNTFNSTIGLLNSVINPVRNILRDITNVSNQAIALVNLVNNAVTGLGRAINGSINGLSNDFNTAIKTLGKASGAIGTAPITVAQSLARMFSSSTLDINVPFLKTTSKLTFSRPALPIGSPPSPSKAALLAAIIPFDIQEPVL